MAISPASGRADVELTDVSLGYLERGASSVRLDAIGFLWKESGSTCLHHRNTHAIVDLWRAVVSHVFMPPGTQLVTETNVPHAENISYFGDGHDEASMVYQFALPPLVLHAFVSATTTKLSAWHAVDGEPVGDVVQLLGQPRRDRAAPDGGDPHRRRSAAAG